MRGTPDVPADAGLQWRRVRCSPPPCTPPPSTRAVARTAGGPHHRGRTTMWVIRRANRLGRPEPEPRQAGPDRGEPPRRTEPRRTEPGREGLLGPQRSTPRRPHAYDFLRSSRPGRERKTLMPAGNGSAEEVVDDASACLFQRRDGITPLSGEWRDKIAAK